MPTSSAPRGRRILIVSAAMGGGHMQISRELVRRLVEHGHEVRLIDMLDVMPGPAGRWLGRLYPWLVDRAPALYDRIYRVFFLARQDAGERAGVPVRLAVPGLRRVVRAFAPDVTVSTYHLAALAVGRLRAAGEPTGTAVTMITQFAVNDMWLHPAADTELCISELAADEAGARTGRSATVVGPVVRPAFQGAAGDRDRLRAGLGIPDGAWTVLVVSGSLGMGGSAAAATAALDDVSGCVPVVVCGRNDTLRRELAGTAGDRVVLGWVDDMAALMSAADVLVDNAGGMSSKEALGIGLPVVTFRPIAGHGRDDAAAMGRLGVTEVIDDPAALVATVGRLRDDPGHYRERVRRGRALFVTDAARVVAGTA